MRRVIDIFENFLAFLSFNNLISNDLLIKNKPQNTHFASFQGNPTNIMSSVQVFTAKNDDRKIGLPVVRLSKGKTDHVRPDGAYNGELHPT